MIGRLLAFALVFASSAAVGASQVPLQPTGKWIADFEDDGCSLTRDYGTNDKPLLLVFEQEPLDPGFAVSIFKHVRRLDWDSGQARLTFGTDEPRPAKFAAYTGEKIGLRRVMVEEKDISLKSVAADDVVRISVPGEADDSFALPDFAAAEQLLQECAVDLGKSWGFPAAEQARILKAPASLKPEQGLFTPDDYPAAALKQNATGITKVRVMVDKDGMPTDCALLKPSGNQALDSVTCNVMLKRARFHPAIDVDGNPTRSIVIESVNWLLF